MSFHIPNHLFYVLQFIILQHFSTFYKFIIQILLQITMFIAEALADFSAATMQSVVSSQQNQKEDAEQLIKQSEEINDNSSEKSESQRGKRPRTKSQEKKLLESFQNDQLGDDKSQHNQSEKHQDKQQQFKYTQFLKGDKIIVKETFQNGWWYGHPVKKSQLIGFFPSNYVKVGVQPPPPAPPKKVQNQSQEAQGQIDHDAAQIRKQLDQLNQGPVKSDYYQGIKGYKMVKINQKNESIKNGNHVQFDVNTNLARVPIKDQAPTAKAVRQMGYYFDFHQWNEQRNQNPGQKARPDPKKKKAKKLNLKMMNY